MADSLDEILRVKAAAEFLSLSPSTLNKLRCTGGGPPFVALTARARGYRRRDLVAFAASRLRRTTSDGVDYRPNADKPTNRDTGTTAVADVVDDDYRPTVAERLEIARASRQRDEGA